MCPKASLNHIFQKSKIYQPNFLHINPVSYCSDCRFLDHYHIRDMCICINQDLEVTHVQLEAAAEEAVVEAAVVS